jgi:hypothetical protein
MLPNPRYRARHVSLKAASCGSTVTANASMNCHRSKSSPLWIRRHDNLIADYASFNPEFFG